MTGIVLAQVSLRVAVILLQNLGSEKGKTPEAVKSLIALLESAPSKPSHML